MTFRSQVLDLIPENKAKADKHCKATAIYKLIHRPCDLFSPPMPSVVSDAIKLLQKNTNKEIRPQKCGFLCKKF